MTISTQVHDANFDWLELIPERESGYSPSAIHGVFHPYQRAISKLDKHSTNKKKRRKLPIFRRALRNCYMEALISGEEKVAKRTCQLATLLGEDYAKLTEDINSLVGSGYNPHWKIGLLFLQLMFKQKPWRKKQLDEIVKLTYDGQDSLDEIDNDPLLAYRIVTNLEPFKTDEKTIVEVALSVFSNITTYFSVEKDDPPSPSLFNQTFYYLCVLKYNEKLRNVFTSMLQLFYRFQSGDDTPQYSADDFFDTLFNKSSSKTRKKILKILDHMRRSTDKSFFTLNLEESVISKGKSVSINPFDINKKPYHLLANIILQQCLSYPLPQLYRKSLTPRFIDNIEGNFQLTNESKLKKYYQILQWLYHSAETLSVFKADSIRVACKIHEVSRTLYKETEIKHIEDSWTKLCKGKLSSKELEAVAKDLSLESVRLIRQVMLKDINKKLVEFEEVFEPEQDESDNSASSLSDSSFSEFRTTSLASISDSFKNSSSDLTSSPRTDLTLSKSISPRTEFNSNVEVVTKSLQGDQVQSPEIEDSFNYTDFFENITYLIAYEILTAKSKKNAVSVIKNLLLFAKQCVELPIPNLQVAYAITSAFDRDSVTRLEHLFNSLPSKYTEIYQELCELFSPRNHNLRYREFCEKTTTPVIPCMPIHEKELTLLTESSDPEQQFLKKQICDKFLSMQHLLKISNPLHPYRSDCVSIIKNPTQVYELAAPEKKIDFDKKEKDFKAGEWDSLPMPDKLYYYSRFYWKNITT